MDQPPQYSHTTSEKEVLEDNKKLAAETNAILPQAVSRDEKGIYVDTFGNAPEVVNFENADKELDTRPEPRDPEAIASDSPLYHVHDGMMDSNGQRDRPNSMSAPEAHIHTKKEPRRFCGLAKWPFIFVVVACVLAIAVALGAGLATTLSKKSNSPAVAATAAATASSSSKVPLSTTPNPSATSSTAAATPSLRDFRDTVKYNLTVYEGKDYKGAWQFIDRVGNFKLGFNVSSYYWHCGQFTTREMCSMAFCVDEELAAWRGGEDRALNDIGSVLSKLPNRVKIMCGSTFGNPGCVAETYTMTPTVFPTPPVPDSTSFTKR